MNPRSKMYVWCFMALLLLALPLTTSAAHKLTMQVFHAGYEMNGNPSPDRVDTSYYWLDGDLARVDESDNKSFIFNGATGMMQMLNHIDKKYTPIEPGAFGKLITAQGGDDSAAIAQAKGMLDMMKVKARVTPTEETKNIGEYNCKKWIYEIEIAMTTTTTEAWVTEDVEFDYDAFLRLSQAMKAFLPGFEDAAKELAKMKGVVISSTTSASFMGIDIKTTTDLIAIEEVTPPDGYFAVPEGYTEAEMPMPGMN